MPSTLRAALVYSLILVATRLGLGLLRLYLLVPLIGTTLTAAFELPVLLIVAWSASRTLIHRCGVRRDLGQGALMGVITLAVLLAAEAVGSALMGRSLAEHLALYAGAPELMGLAGEILLAFFPAIQIALTHSRHR